MQKKVLVPVSNGTEDVESTVIIDLLRRAEAEETVAGTHSQVTYARGLKVIPDKLLSEISLAEDFDAVIIPGGQPGVDNLTDDRDLKEILKKHNAENKLTGAICAAPLLLKKHGLFEKNSVLTSFPALKNEFTDYNYSEHGVAVFENMITSRGLGTAIDFALNIIEILYDSEKADNIAKEIVYTK